MIYSTVKRPKIKKYKIYFYLVKRDDKVTYFMLFGSLSQKDDKNNS